LRKWERCVEGGWNTLYMLNVRICCVRIVHKFSQPLLAASADTTVADSTLFILFLFYCCIPFSAFLSTLTFEFILILLLSPSVSSTSSSSCSSYSPLFIFSTSCHTVRDDNTLLVWRIVTIVLVRTENSYHRMGFSSSLSM
jgi:hypothetical protein